MALKFIRKNRIAFVCVAVFLVLIAAVSAATVSARFAGTGESGVDSAEYEAGYGLYIDNEFVASVRFEEVASQTLDTVLKARTAEFGGKEVIGSSFTNIVSIVYSDYYTGCFVTSQELLALLGLESGDSYTAEVHNYLGDVLTASLNVRVTVRAVNETEIAPSVVYVDNSNLLSTHENIVLSEGQPGVTADTYEYIYVNGECISAKYVSSEVLAESVDRVIERGVLDGETISAASENTSVENSPFIMPYDGGYISSGYGWRSMGWHSGIDIIRGDGISCYGDAFWAARDGVVIFAGESGTYGQVIMLQHEDGSETVYAHCSVLKVEQGDYVEQGQVIGNIGTTGYVTGPHLHFEIRIDGQTVNPLKFVRLYS